MSFLCWNYRGFGNQRTEYQLAELVQAQAPSVVFLAKAWTNKARLELVQRCIDFKNKFDVPRRNKGGWISNFWKADFDLEVKTFSEYHIDTTINKNKEDEWRFTGFYGGAGDAKETQSLG